jgi:lipopolysaccharide cholinephosphotransferase
MNQNHNDQIKQLHFSLLKILDEIDRICRINNINYYLDSGTALGAIRHQGFIPWDDDADIALLRDEYERFREACKTELDTSRFYFQDHTNTPGYRWGYGKIRRKGTLFLRENQENFSYEQGIFLDVFPLDNVPDGGIVVRRLHGAACWLIRKLLWSEVGKTEDISSFWRMVFRYMSAVPLERVFHFYEKFFRWGNRKKTKWVRILTYPTPTKDEGYLRQWYDESALVSFEGRMFSGIKDFDGYLTFKFGNWRELPPASEQESHLPVSQLVLVEPQLDAGK